MDTKIFRKVALDRLASPERLDQVMEVTTRKAWISLSAIFLLLAAATVWGVAGSISDDVQAQGILVRGGGVLEVVAPAPGRITDVSVAAGDSVAEGDVVAWVSQPELAARLEEAEARLEELIREREQDLEFLEKEHELQRVSLRRRRQGLEGAIEAAEKTRAWLEGRIEAQEKLVREGLLTRTALMSTRERMDLAREKIHSAEGELASIEVTEAGLDARWAEEVSRGDLAVERGRREVERLERAHRAASRVVSPYNGRILEVTVERGHIVAKGQPMLSLDLMGRSVRDLVGVVYVPAAHGKKVRPGMTVYVAPSTVRQEEYGMMRGRVTYVSSYPATLRGMRTVLKNEQLVQMLSASGAPYEVHAELEFDPRTRSRYRWTSSGGPPTEIQSGTLASAQVKVGSERPIAMVIPMLRRWTGI